METLLEETYEFFKAACADEIDFQGDLHQNKL